MPQNVNFGDEAKIMDCDDCGCDVRVVLQPDPDRDDDLGWITLSCACTNVILEDGLQHSAPTPDQWKVAFN